MADRLYEWVVARVGARRLVMLAMLLVALASVALGLADVTRGLGQRGLLVLAWGGVVVGWGLAERRLRPWVAALSAAVSGMGIVLVWVGQLDQSLRELLTRTWRVPWAEHPLRALGQDVTTVLGRVQQWVQALVAGEPGYDPVAVALLWSLALWAVSAWAGWAGRRERPLLAILPATLLLLLTLSYTDGELYYLLPLLATTFFMLVLAGHAIRERSWEARGVDYSLELRTDHFLVAVSLSVGLTALAAVAPSVSVGGVTRAVQTLMSNSPVEVQPLADSLGLERPPSVVSPFDAYRAPGLPRAHLIGAGPELGEQVVMMIEPQAPVVELLPRRWLSTTYDRYSGRGWSSSQSEVELYEAGEAAITPSPDVPVVAHRIEMNRLAGGLLYIPGPLVSSDQPYSVAWRSGIDFFGGYTEAASYEVTTLAPVLGAEALRGAGTAYPQRIARRYLALPERVPERVLALARELTATEPTPYDRARAIERYLRTFPYNVDLPAPPPGRELADYFLFDLQAGYCDYYATTMVVLARAAGIPARLAVGYATGDFDEETQRYTVTEAEGHSWPELYFPGYGWVPFEPTAIRESDDLPAEGIAAEPFDTEWVGLSERLARAVGSLPWRLLPIIGGFLLVVGIAASLWDRWRLRRLPPGEALARVYGRFARLGQRVVGGAHAGATPYEFVTSLAQRVQEIDALSAIESRGGAALLRHLDAIPEAAHRLAALYVGSAYAPAAPSDVQRQAALTLWRRLRWRLWLAWLLGRAG